MYLNKFYQRVKKSNFQNGVAMETSCRVTIKCHTKMLLDKYKEKLQSFALFAVV